MSDSGLDKFYLLKFWFGSLLISSILLLAFVWYDPDQTGADSIREIISAFVFVNFAGLIFSFPSFLLITIIFFILKPYKVPAVQMKIILVSITLILVLVTFLILVQKDLSGTDMWKYVVAYFAGTIIAGFICRIEPKRNQTRASNTETV